MDVERKLTSIRFIKLSYLYNLKYQKKILAHMNLNIGKRFIIDRIVRLQLL